jgi:hybrid cluster-associated redox disulfide protein
MKIDSETTLKEILENSELAEVLEKYGLPCLSCPMAKFEMEKLKIGQVCQIYGLDLQRLLKELNQKNGKKTS